MENIKLIPIEQLHPHPENPRKDLGDLTELADSIKANGVFQNLTVVPWSGELPGKKGKKGQAVDGYRVIIGHRRMAASKLAGLSELPCAVVEMTEAEQVRTMLMENMQRSDLTVYEQAQGFQLMLDMGGTVESVAKDTGFSEATVRRRVKLLDLDPKEFKKSEARGATLFDYMELDKVADPEEKNNLLKSVGTPKFRANLERALDDQKRKERTEKIKSFLSEFATEAEQVDTDAYAYVCQYSPWDKEEKLEKPQDADSREYVFKVNTWGTTLYRKKDKSDLEEEAARSAERKEAEDKRKARQDAVREVSDRCEKLRRDFVMGLSATACKKLVPVAVAKLILDAFDNGDIPMGSDDLDTICPGLEDGQAQTIDQIAGALGNTDRAIVRLAYLSAEPCDGYYQTWGDCCHTENEVLDDCYEFLAKLGYEMSEEEKQFQDGTHEIFQAQEGDVG